MTPATSVNYGAGFPGRHGVVPTLTAREPPWRGSTVDVDVGNSSNYYVVAFLVVGLTRDDLPTGLGGDLLLDPMLWVVLPLWPSGATFTADVPTDWWADGLPVDLQTLELDPWAAHGVSFTPGLELTLGDG
jgi:hypothetical protein